MSRLEKIQKNKTDQPLVYSRTEKVTERHIRGPIIVTIILLLSGGLVYLLFFSGIFNIKNIEVTGYTNPDKIKELATEQIGGGPLSSNIILFNNGSLTDTLKGDPLIFDVSTRKIFPNKIVIDITESKPAVIWTTAGDSFLLDERGDVIGQNTSNLKGLPIVYDSSGIKIARGDKVASPTFISFINKVWTGFEPASGAKLSKITIFDLINDIHVLSSNGWTVYLDASKDPAIELENLTKVLKVAQQSGRKLEYIDLRLDTKAYYK